MSAASAFVILQSGMLLLQISLSIACFALPQLSPWYQDAVLIHSIPFLIPLAQMTLSGSSFTTVALTVERYISLCSPYLRYTYNIRAHHFILPVLVFSTLYNMPRLEKNKGAHNLSFMPTEQYLNLAVFI